MKNSASCIPDPSPFPPDSPDETASGQLRTPILIGESKSYDGSGGGVPTDPTGERRNRQFAQHFRSLRSCLSNLSEESGIKYFEKSPNRIDFAEGAIAGTSWLIV